jgi:nitrogen-specific signal transduction histidine kinase
MATFFTRREAGARRAANAPRVGLVYLNTQKRKLYCLNDVAHEMVGEGVPMSAADLARRPLLTLAGEPVKSDELPLVRAWREAAPQEATFQLDRSGGGAPKLVHWSAAPLCDESEAVVGVTGSVMVLAPEPDWQVMAGLAHDLRTPLQALRLLVPLLEETNLPPEARELAQRVRSAADRSLSVGLDLLEWCRAPTEGRRVNRTWFALAPFLRGLADEQRAGAQRKRITLHVDLKAADGWEAHTDPVRLGRLLANLLSNAIRYTPSGRVLFAALARPPQGDDGPTLALRVVDTGSGIPADEQESIFLPFERGRTGREGDSGGSGVGLAVVDRLVEELGLTLEVFSEFGQGSSFEVVLPAAELRRETGG